MRPRFVLLLVSLAVTATVVSCAGDRTNDTSNAAAMDTYCRQAADTWRFQGAVLVARDDRVLYSRGVGMANVERQLPNTPATRFPIGSITKVFTGAAIMRLWDQGRIDLDSSLSTYLPDYRRDIAERVTLHHLLAHTSGIPDLLTSPDFRQQVSQLTGEVTPEDLLAIIESLDLKFEPGARYDYSSSGYILLGRVIEQVTGRPWGDAVRELVTQPLRLKHTTAEAPWESHETWATGYAPTRLGDSLQAVPPLHPSIGYAAGALSSTVGDLRRFAAAMLDTMFLSADAQTWLFTAHTPRRGHSWLVDDFGGHRLLAHGGGVPGFNATLQIWPDDSLVVIVLCNQVTAASYNVANGLAAIALGEEIDPPTLRFPAEIAPEEMTQYVGTYIRSSSDRRRVTAGENGLLIWAYTDISYALKREADDQFFYAHDPMITVAFLRDSHDSVTALVMNQAFDCDTARRVME